MHYFVLHRVRDDFVAKKSMPPMSLPSPADNHENRGAGRSALGRMPEMGGEFQVVALTKPEDPVGDFDIDVTGNDEKSFLPAVAHFTGDTGSGGQLNDKDLHVMRLIRATEKRVTVAAVFGSKVTRLSLTYTDQMDGVLIDILSEQKGYGSAERLRKAHQGRNREGCFASLEAGEMALAQVGLLSQLVERQFPLLTQAARVGSLFGARCVASDF